MIIFGCRLDIFMPHQLFYKRDVRTVIEECGAVSVPQDVWRNLLINSCFGAEVNEKSRNIFSRKTSWINPCGDEQCWIVIKPHIQIALNPMMAARIKKDLPSFVPLTNNLSVILANIKSFAI